MTFRRWLARLIDPSIDAVELNEAKYRWLKSLISSDARWLAEFDDVSKTLERLLMRDFNHWRSLDQIAHPNDQWPEIGDFRMMLRRRREIREKVLIDDLKTRLRHEMAAERQAKRSSNRETKQ